MGMTRYRNTANAAASAALRIGSAESLSDKWRGVLGARTASGFFGVNDSESLHDGGMDHVGLLSPGVYSNASAEREA